MYGIRTNIISQNLMRGIFIVDVCHRWHLWIYIALNLNNSQFWLILDIGRVYRILLIYGFFNIGCFHVDACNRKNQCTSMSPYFNIALFLWMHVLDKILKQCVEHKYLLLHNIVENLIPQNFNRCLFYVDACHGW